MSVKLIRRFNFLLLNSLVVLSYLRLSKSRTFLFKGVGIGGSLTYLPASRGSKVGFLGVNNFLNFKNF